MTACRIVLTESQNLVLGQHVTDPWPMTVVKVVPMPLEEEVFVVLAWETDQPVPGHWQWQRGFQPYRYRTLADLEADAFKVGG